MLCEARWEQQWALAFVASNSSQKSPYCFPTELSSDDELCDDTIERLIHLLQGWILNCAWLTLCSTTPTIQDSQYCVHALRH